MKKDVQIENKKEKKKDVDKTFIIVLTVLLGITVVFIPLFYIAEVKKILPILFFVLIPLLFGGLILLLSRNCLVEYKNKKNSIISKISK